MYPQVWVGTGSAGGTDRDHHHPTVRQHCPHSRPSTLPSLTSVNTAVTIRPSTLPLLFVNSAVTLRKLLFRTSSTIIQERPQLSFRDVLHHLIRTCINYSSGTDLNYSSGTEAIAVTFFGTEARAVTFFRDGRTEIVLHGRQNGDCSSGTDKSTGTFFRDGQEYRIILQGLTRVQGHSSGLP